MKILLATFSLIILALLAPPAGRAQFVPGPNPIADTVTAAQTLPSGAGVVSSTGDLEVSGSSVAITVTGTSSIQNDGVINQTGTGRAIRDNTGGLTLSVTNGAGALLQAANADAIQMTKPNSSISFDNYGRVISLNASAGGSQAIDWNAITTGSNTLHNYPTGLLEAFEADGVRPGVNGSVINEGTIKAITSTGSSSDGVDGQANNGLVINNNGQGLIEGGRHGITAGAVDATVSFTLSVTNQRNATIQGDNGSGINIDGFNANEVVTIQNQGTITGNGVTGDGDGVDVDGLVNLTNTGLIRSLNAFSDVPGGASEGITTGGGNITNSGTIEGDVVPGNANAVGRGITLAGVDTSGTPEPIYGNSVVTNSGFIKGQTDSAIVVLGAASGFTVTINNERRGTIEGGGDAAAAIQTGADNDTVNNAGDVIVDASGKAIDLGDGDDTLNISGGTIHGDISGGNGTNTCTIDPGLLGFFTYRSAISDFDSVEIKSGIVSFFGASSYTGTTTISGGIFIVANNTGSATGSGAVQVSRGALGGNGSIDGPVTIGGGMGPAVLAPAALPANEPTLTIQSTLTFQSGGSYLYTFAASRNNSRADKVIANGVTITSGAALNVAGIILGRLPVGTTFTVINNTAVTPIAGTFANLHDGSIITVFGNHLQASYEGGDGNDLTLTVVR
jgi:autotransporter-associated beta strand protein